MSERFMPKKLVMQPEVYITNPFTTECMIRHSKAQKQYDIWFDKEIAPLFENAVEIDIHKTDGAILFNCGHGEHDPKPTHKALLTNLTPIKEETAEDLLREFASYVEWQWKEGKKPSFYDLQQTAKAFLEKK